MSSIESIPYEGGTARLLASAETRDGWSILVMEWTTYRNELRYFAARCNPRGSFLRISDAFRSERQARDFGNDAWRSDR